LSLASIFWGRECYCNATVLCGVFSIHEQSMPHRGDPCGEGASHRKAYWRGKEESVTEEAEKAKDDDEGIIFDSE